MNRPILVCGLLCAALAFPLALFISRSGRWKNLWLQLVILPFWTSFLVRTYAWLFLLGVCAIFRAFLLFNRAAQGDAQEGDGFWRGFWHILGGAILVNIATH